MAYGITHACDLGRVRPAWANKHLGGVTGERLVAELGGVSCLPLELAPAARQSVACQSVACQSVACQSVACQSVACQSVACQSVACTRSFGRVVTGIGELSEAVTPTRPGHHRSCGAMVHGAMVRWRE